MKVLYILLLLLGCTACCYGQHLTGTCNVDGKIVNDGDSVKVDCNTCTCMNGHLGCTEMACRVPQNPVSIKPMDPITTGESMTITCQVTEDFVREHSTDEFDYKIGETIWHKPVGTDVDGNAFIQEEITEPGPVDCQVIMPDNVYNATTNVYFIKEDIDPVVVADGEDVVIECIKDTPADLMTVWLVNGVPVPDLKLNRFTVNAQNGTLQLKEAGIEDIKLSINCTVISKAAYDIFHDVKSAFQQNSAHSFQRDFSVIQFTKQARGQKTLYEADIHGNAEVTLQWFTDSGRVDTNMTTSNTSSITLPSTTVPVLSVSYHGMVLWNDTVQIYKRSKPTNLRQEGSNVGMIIGIVCGLAVVAGLVVVVVYCIRKPREDANATVNQNMVPESPEKKEAEENMPLKAKDSSYNII